MSLRQYFKPWVSLPKSVRIVEVVEKARKSPLSDERSGNDLSLEVYEDPFSSCSEAELI